MRHVKPERRIHRQLAGAFIAVACCVAAFAGAAIAIHFSTVDRAAQLEAEHVAELIANGAMENGAFRPRMQEYVAQLNSLRERDVIIVDAAKKGLADADPDEVGKIYEHDRGNEVGKTIRDGRPRTFIEKNDHHPDGARQVVVPIRQSTWDPSKPIIGAVILEYTSIREEFIAAVRGELYLVAGAGSLVVLLATLFGLGTARRIAQPIRDLKTSVERIAAQDYGARVSVRSHDEIGQLGAAFNKMAEELDAGHERAGKLARVTRVNEILSGINAAIVRIRGRQELFEEACRIAVETGSLPFAWLGVVDEAEMRVRPVASAGAADDGFLELIRGRLSLLDDPPEGHGLTARAVLESRPLVASEIETHPNLKYKQAYAKRGTKSIAALPMFIAGRAVGVLTLHAPQVGFFDEAEMKLLNEVAGNIAFALEHIEKEEKVRRLTRVNAMLSGINGAIVHIRDRKELFEEACRIAVETGRFPLAWVGVLDREANVLVPVAWEGPGREHMENFRPKIGDATPDEESLSSQAIREKRAVVSNDVASDPRVILRVKMAAHGLGSAVVLPLIVQGVARGTLTLLAIGNGAFDDEEMKLLNEVAGNVAFALEHIEKEEKVRRLTRVYAVLSQINGLIVRVRDRGELFDAACRIAVEEGRFRMCWIGLAERNATRIDPVAYAGSTPEHMAFIRTRISLAADTPMGDNLVAHTLRSKKAHFCNDTQNDPAYRFRKEHADKGTRSVAVLPLLVADEAIGVLALYAEEAGFFDAEELKLLTELAEDISFALENINRQQYLDKLARVRAVSSEINAAIVRIRERKALLEETCRIAAEHGKFEMIWVGALDHDAREIQPIAWKGFSEQSAHAVNWAGVSASKGSLGEAIQTRTTAVRNDIQGELRAGELGGEALKQGCRSSACLPLVVDDKVTGLVVLFAPGRGFFDAEELALLNEVASDISFALQSIEKQKKLEYLSYYDALTGLANRTLFLERVAQYVRSAAGDGHKLALFLVDLERFKNINDSLGRPAGDALLKLVAQWMMRNLGDASLLARIGADHFAVVLPEVRQGGDVARLLDKLMEAFLEHPFKLNDAVFRIATKVGIALFPDDGADADALFKNAEAALKKAKASGDRYLFYTQKMTDAVAGKLTLENQLRQALDKGEFVLHYQPKVSLATGKLTSAEALIRWNDPRTGLVPPGRFIPVLEETGLIYEVGRWALRKSLEDYLRWRAAGLPAVRIAVNVSPMQLRNRDFVTEIGEVISIDPHAAAGLELEITESLIMEDVKHNIASLQAIRAMGVSIAIDDFGTGFSSLSYLAKLPVDTLKIDRSFVIDMTAGPQGLALVSTIINLAHSLKLKVVAEGVETEEQSRLLRLLSCDEMQGFLFSKPVPGEIFEAKFLARLPDESAAMPAAAGL